MKHLRAIALSALVTGVALTTGPEAAAQIPTPSEQVTLPADVVAAQRAALEQEKTATRAAWEQRARDLDDRQLAVEEQCKNDLAKLGRSEDRQQEGRADKREKLRREMVSRRAEWTDREQRARRDAEGLDTTLAGTLADPREVLRRERIKQEAKWIGETEKIEKDERRKSGRNDKKEKKARRSCDKELNKLQQARVDFQAEQDGKLEEWEQRAQEIERLQSSGTRR